MLLIVFSIIIFLPLGVLRALHLELDSQYCVHKEKVLSYQDNPLDVYGSLGKLALLWLVDLICPLFIT